MRLSEGKPDIQTLLKEYQKDEKVQVNGSMDGEQQEELNGHPPSQENGEYVFLKLSYNSNNQFTRFLVFSSDFLMTVFSTIILQPHFIIKIHLIFMYSVDSPLYVYCTAKELVTED